jgi:hypothetical protein
MQQAIWGVAARGLLLRETHHGRVRSQKQRRHGQQTGRITQISLVLLYAYSKLFLCALQFAWCIRARRRAVLRQGKKHKCQTSFWATFVHIYDVFLLQVLIHLMDGWPVVYDCRLRGNRNVRCTNARGELHLLSINSLVLQHTTQRVTEWRKSPRECLCF